MLTVQPIAVRNTVKPAFKGFDEDTYKQERSFYQDQINQFDDFINDDHIPNPIKRPFKWIRTLSSAIVDGLAVAWATFTALKYGKNAYTRFADSKFANSAAKNAGKIKTKASKLFENVTEFASKQYTKFKTSKYGQKISGWIDAFKNSKFGSKAIEYTKKAYNGTKTFVQNILNKFKKADVAEDVAKESAAKTESNKFEKVAKGVSAAMGTGSGIAGAYASTVEDKDPEDMI